MFPNLKKRRKKYTMWKQGKNQLETTVKKRKHVWPKKFCFIKTVVFCWNTFSENTAKLVIDNVACGKL